MVKWLLLTVGIGISFTSASNILIWSPTFGHSHVAFLGNIADVLTADGHNVTILTLTLDPNVTTFGNHLPAHTIRIESEENNWLQMDVKGPSLWNTPPCTGLCTRTSDLLIIAEQSYRICKALLDDDETMKKLRASKFDLVFSETLENCGPGVFQVLNIPSVVMVSALGMMPKMLEISGLRATPSFVPLCLTPYSDEMTFFERFVNFNLLMIFSTYKYKVEDEYWQLLNDRYPGLPSIESISMNKTALMMTNVHEFAESPRPTTNMIRYVGGMTMYPPKALSKELNDLLNLRRTNVLFSMGTFALSKDMPAQLKTALIETFASHLNTTFIWKYEDDDHNPFKGVPNIYPMSWVPQTDLLADSRISLLITHGGMNSMLEAMQYGKPMIVVPLFSDQQMNAKTVLRRGIGVILERHHLNKESMTSAIRYVLSNKDIAKRCALIKELLDGRPKQYRDDVAKYTRLIIEHGRFEHLPLYSRNMTSLQYYSLDVIAFELVVIAVGFYVCFWIISAFLFTLRKIKLKAD